MKKAALLFVLSLAGYSGFSQEFNAVNNEIFYGDQKIIFQYTHTGFTDRGLLDINILIMNLIETEEEFIANSHEFIHEPDTISKSFDIKESAFSLNEFAMNTNR